MSSTLISLMISAFIIISSVCIMALSGKNVMLAKRILLRTYLSGFILGLLCLLFVETNRTSLILLSLFVLVFGISTLVFGIITIAAFLKARHLHRKSKEEKEEEAEGGELR